MIDDPGSRRRQSRQHGKGWVRRRNDALLLMLIVVLYLIVFNGRLLPW